MFSCVLVADRAEIASRVTRTVQRVSSEAYAIYCEADADVRDVAEADAAILIGGPAPADRCPNTDRFIRAARELGGDAVHLGYGFLFEDAAFAAGVIDAGIVWNGPSPEAIRNFGDKIESRSTAAAAPYQSRPASPTRSIAWSRLIESPRCSVADHDWGPAGGSEIGVGMGFARNDRHQSVPSLGDEHAASGRASGHRTGHARRSRSGPSRRRHRSRSTRLPSRRSANRATPSSYASMPRTVCASCGHRVTAWQPPTGRVRVDSGYAVGNIWTPYYDRLLAKLCCVADSPHEAPHVARGIGAVDHRRHQDATALPPRTAWQRHVCRQNVRHPSECPDARERGKTSMEEVRAEMTANVYEIVTARATLWRATTCSS